MRSAVSRAQLKKITKKIQPWLEDLARELKFTSKQKQRIKAARRAELGVVFVRSSEIRRLNRRYRGKNKSTDILSFEGDLKDSWLGDLVLCPEILKSQARHFCHSPKEETIYIFIHGVLHLLGFEHEKSETAAQIMIDIQDTLYGRL